ncbi:MAG: hypothetical protein ABFC80_04285 [Coriobacteriales bacterium]
MFVPVAAVDALVNTSIGIDGSFGDWAPVFDDPANAVPDATGDQTDPNTDLTLAAVTSDSTNLYIYTRRAAASGGGASPDFYAWIDRGGDGRMHTGDMVAVFGMGGGNQFQGASLYRYVAAAGAAGDPMPGDNGWPAGTWNTAVTPLPSAPSDGAGEPSGVQFEGRVSWEAVGMASGSAVIVQIGSKLGSKTDSTDAVSLVRRAVTVEPDRFSGAAAGSTVSYTHTITNTGNVTSTYDLATSSSKGWSTSVRALDGTAISQVTLASGNSTDVVVAVTVPPTTADGTKDTTTLTATETSSGSADSASDLTTVGSVIVVPDQSGRMAPGGTAVYRTTITNTTSEQRTLDLSASSTKSWPVEVRDESGVATTQVVLGPASSVSVYVRVSVPAGTSAGVTDVTTLQARDTNAPSVRGSGRDTTTCAPKLSLEPDNAEPAGPGAVITYVHTLSNNWESTRTIALSAVSSRGWTVRLYDQDGTTPLTSVTLAPQGGTRTIYARVSVPVGTAAGVVDTTTVTAACETDSDTARDVTSVSRLVTYSNGGYSMPSSQFVLGDTVYVRAMGLGGGATVSLRWLRPDDTVAYAKSNIKADSTGVVSSSYTLPGPEVVGMWKVVLLDSGNTEITRSSFWVGYRATIDSVTVSGGDSIGSTVTVSAPLDNSGAVALTGGTVTHLIWWDADGDAVFDAGDSYVAPDGSWQAYTAGASTHSTTMNAPAGAVTSEPAWGVSNEGFLESGTYTLSTSWVAANGVIVDQATTTFFAVPGKPWLQLTLSENAIDFGTISPGVQYTHSGLGLHVQANVPFDLQKSESGSFAELGLSSTLADLAGIPSGASDYTDVVSVDAPWTTSPGTYTATIIYTVVMH